MKCRTEVVYVFNFPQGRSSHHCPLSPPGKWQPQVLTTNKRRYTCVVAHVGTRAGTRSPHASLATLSALQPAGPVWGTLWEGHMAHKMFCSWIYLTKLAAVIRKDRRRTGLTLEGRKQSSKRFGYLVISFKKYKFVSYFFHCFCLLLLRKNLIITSCSKYIFVHWYDNVCTINSLQKLWLWMQAFLKGAG